MMIGTEASARRGRKMGEKKLIVELWDQWVIGDQFILPPQCLSDKSCCFGRIPHRRDKSVEYRRISDASDVAYVATDRAYVATNKGSVATDQASVATDRASVATDRDSVAT